MAKAKEDPKSPEAKELFAVTLPMLKIAGSDVPFGPLQSARLVPKIYAMGHRFHAHTVFLTLAPNDIEHPLVLRLSYPSVDNKSFPFNGQHKEGDSTNGPSFVEVLRECPPREEWFDIPISRMAKDRLVSANPVAAALIFERLTKVILEDLIGLTQVQHVKKTVPLWDASVKTAGEKYGADENPFAQVFFVIN